MRLGDGLFLEWAVFTTDDVRRVPIAGRRVVWSRPGFVLPEGPPPPEAPDLVMVAAIRSLLPAKE